MMERRTKNAENYCVIGREIARTLGVQTPQEVAQVIESDPQALAKLHDYERDNAQELALLAQEQAHLAEILRREDKGSFFRWGWRPAFMWLLALFWAMNLVITPVFLNGILGLGVPLAPFDALITLTGLYLALYMGGHTVLRALRERS